MTCQSRGFRFRAQPMLVVFGPLLLVVVVLVSTQQPALAAPASTFTVNSPADVPDLNLGDPACDTGGGACTLRAAVQQANFHPGPDIIALPAYTMTLTRSGYDDSALNGDLDVSGVLTITGVTANNSFIDGNGANTHDRVFHLLSGANVVIQNVYIQHGQAITTAANVGGDIYIASGATLTLKSAWVVKGKATYGGAIMNEGTLRLIFGLIGDSSAQNGGAIYNSGLLTGENPYLFYAGANLGSGLFNGGGSRAILSGAQIYNNFGSSTNVISASGGAIYNVGALTLTNSALSYNGVELGGGIYNGGSSSLYISNTELVGNAAGSIGGGLVNFGVVHAVNSLIDQNTSHASGGGIYNGGIGGGTIQLVNSTVSGNRADLDGGGIYNYSGSTNLYNVTVASNVADDDNNDASTGGGIFQAGGTVNLQNSILANNIHRSGLPLLSGDDCKGTLNSGGYNLVENTSGCTIGGIATGNQTGIDPMLGPLQDNGGATYTHALRANSPAIDTGNPSGCTDPLGAILAQDQRGSRRPINGTPAGAPICDIGAYEYMPTLWLPLIVR